MDFEALVGVYCFVGMLVMVMIGVPIFISMFLSAFIGYWVIGGSSFALTQFTNAPYEITSNYTFAVIPMFILMGILAAESGIAQDAYIAVSKWFSQIRGGPLMATVGAAALFGACSGASLASSAVFTKISLPELEKHKYDRNLSMGCMAASGGLSSLIPPSIPIIIFCVLTQVSVGKALAAGIIPGIILMIMFILSIWAIGKISKNKIPSTDIKISWKERFVSLKMIWPILVLFLLAIGGIYAGIFPPTVGGAVGAAGALVYALFRRIGKKKILNSFWETVLINAQLFPIVMAGFFFGRFIALSGLPADFVDLITSANLHPAILITLVVILYIFLGCVMEILSILIITIPVIFPILTSLGFEPLSLCIALVFLSEIASLTPPIGMTVFIVASVAKVDPIEVFRGIFPFFLLELVLLIIILVFPVLTTWLPNILF
jgi:tripartite ATP-independent transporter DctM subunit